jgi:hypothetical protein
MQLARSDSIATCPILAAVLLNRAKHNHCAAYRCWRDTHTPLRICKKVADCTGGEAVVRSATAPSCDFLTSTSTQ